MSALAELIAARIRREGTLSVAEFMALANGHPRHGYYATRDPLGAAGDFTTSPEISQMFGELIGLWCADGWAGMGRPDPVRLVELGPGRGTLMGDALRAIGRTAPEFRHALQIHLVETSPTLRARQAEHLAAARPRWHHAFDEVPDGPLLLVANEFFDALPVRQRLMTASGWVERRIGLADGALGFVAGPPAAPDPLLPSAAPIGAVVEDSPAGRALAREIGRRVARQGGAALVIDYGHAIPGLGDTLQAVRRHRYAPALDAPGEVDLSAQVDFAALAAAAQAGGAATHGPVGQGEFLRRLGIDARAARLARDATPDQARAVDAALRRLTAPDAMGALFKVMAIAAAGRPAPAGFEGGSCC